MMEFTFDLYKLQVFSMILLQQDTNHNMWPWEVHQTVTIPGFLAN